ncbi:hypothetical protein EDB83DRAFT_1445808 [Lactarius deliciosus]|nr:hypothetical protein EDB83DRAFT_1445808 [Lactarius deliciosus]
MPTPPHLCVLGLSPIIAASPTLVPSPHPLRASHVSRLTLSSPSHMREFVTSLFLFLSITPPTCHHHLLSHPAVCMACAPFLCLAISLARAIASLALALPPRTACVVPTLPTPSSLSHEGGCCLSLVISPYPPSPRPPLSLPSPESLPFLSPCTSHYLPPPASPAVSPPGLLPPYPLSPLMASISLPARHFTALHWYHLPLMRVPYTLLTPCHRAISFHGDRLTSCSTKNRCNLLQTIANSSKNLCYDRKYN